jgi:beta-phosphoglucomutase-like phosphatase (HAD superfamily)
VKAGWTVAVASTSAEESVRAVLVSAVGADVAAEVPIFAGDVVATKKPDRAIYRLAVSELGHGYTRGEDSDEAVLTVASSR